MKKNYKLILVMTMILTAVISLTAYAAIEGDGSEESPFLITKEEHLFLLEDFPTSHFRLSNDIEMTVNISQPLCKNCDYQAFQGVLDGDGHTIYNLKLISDGSYNNTVSLFHTNRGVIKNLNIENADIKGISSYAIAINNNYSGEIINCTFSMISGGGPGNSCGIVCTNDGIIDGCKVSGELKGCGESCGIALNSSGKILNCVVDAKLSGSKNYGIVGCNVGTIANCEFTGTIDDTFCDEAAGIAGLNGGRYSGESNIVYRDAVITGCKVNGNLQIDSSYDSTAGGICIQNYTLIQNSYFIGELSACTVGGIAVINGQKHYDDYYNPEIIENCYVVASLNYTDSGNIIAENNDGSKITNCFFDKNVSGISSDLNGKAMSTIGMKIIQTYRDYWDFDEVWAIDEEINDGYPHLLWEQKDSSENMENPSQDYFLSQLNNSSNREEVKNLVLTYGQYFGYDIYKYEMLTPSVQIEFWNKYAHRIYSDIGEAVEYYDMLIEVLRKENNNSGSSSGGGGGGGEIVYSGNCGDDISWCFENGVLTFDGTGEMYDYDEGTTPWYEFCEDIVSVCMSDEITGIGRNSFRNLTALKTVILPECLLEIRSCAFENSGIEAIGLPSQLERIEDGAFRSCESLKNIVIPDSVTYMSDSVFHFCYQLETAVVSNGLTELERNMFDECINLREITLPEGLTRIGNDAFKNTQLMDESNYVNGILYIDNYLIKAKNNIVTANIKDGTTLIGTNAFSDCQLLNRITIPDSVMYIHDESFAGSRYMENSSNWENGLLYIENHLIKARDIIGHVTVKDGTKTIAGGAFRGNYDMTDIVIPDSVAVINESAFRDCNRLKNITLGTGVRFIGREAFACCDETENLYIKDLASYINIKREDFDSGHIAPNLYVNGSLITDLVIPYEITVLENDVFGSFISIRTVSLHNNITEIGERAFDGCYSLEKVIFDGTREEWNRINVLDGNHSLIEALVFVDEFEPEQLIDVKLTNGVYLVSSISLRDDNCVVFVCYDGDKTVYTDYWKYRGDYQIYPFCPNVNYDSVKLFVWESMNTLRPLCSAVEK